MTLEIHRGLRWSIVEILRVDAFPAKCGIADFINNHSRLVKITTAKKLVVYLFY